MEEVQAGEGAGVSAWTVGIVAVVILGLLFLERIATSSTRVAEDVAHLAGRKEPAGASSPWFMIVVLCAFVAAAVWCFLR